MVTSHRLPLLAATGVACGPDLTDAVDRAATVLAVGSGKGSVDMKWTKKVIFVLVVGFCLFYLIQQPEGAAEAVRTVFGALVRAFQAIVTFFTSLSA